jgi:hypothetical protein
MSSSSSSVTSSSSSSSSSSSCSSSSRFSSCNNYSSIEPEISVSILLRSASPFNILTKFHFSLRHNTKLNVGQSQSSYRYFIFLRKITCNCRYCTIKRQDIHKTISVSVEHFIEFPVSYKKIVRIQKNI